MIDAPIAVPSFMSSTARSSAVGGMCLQIVCREKLRAVSCYAGFFLELAQGSFLGRFAGLSPSPGERIHVGGWRIAPEYEEEPVSALEDS